MPDTCTATPSACHPGQAAELRDPGSIGRCNRFNRMVCLAPSHGPRLGGRGDKREGGKGAHGRIKRNGCVHGLAGIIPTALINDRFGPFAAGDLGDFIGQIDQCVPCGAASIDKDLFVVVDTVGQEVLAKVLPDVLDRVEFR